MRGRLVVHAFAAAILLGCADNPQRLPVGVSACRAVQLGSAFGILARVQNKSDRPISQLDMTSAFYQNFRYQRFDGSARLIRELDPGASAEVTFRVAARARPLPQGRALRCFVTHIGYLDGSAQDVPAQQ